VKNPALNIRARTTNAHGYSRVKTNIFLYKSINIFTYIFMVIASALNIARNQVVLVLLALR
jgi:hypothetical protein